MADPVKMDVVGRALRVRRIGRLALAAVGLDAVAGGMLIAGLPGAHRSVLVGGWMLLLGAGAVAVRFPLAGLVMAPLRGMEAIFLLVGSVGHGHLLVGCVAATAALLLGLSAASLRCPQVDTRLASAHDFTSDEVERAISYRRRVRVGGQLAAMGWLASMAAMACAASRVSIRQDIQRLPWEGALPLVVATVYVFSSAPLLAFSAYRGLRLDPSFGLATRSARDWWRDSCRDLIAGMSAAIVGAGLIWGAVRLMSPWWLGAAVALSAVTVAVYGTHPLRFGLTVSVTPAGPELQATADMLADAARVPHTPVLVASMRTRWAAPNAFVAGLGRMRRIVVFGSLLDCDLSYIRAVLAHEVGHAGRRHVERRLALVVCLNLATVPLLAALGSGGALGWFRGGNWSAAAYPAFACIEAVITAYSSIVVVAMARRQEQAADRFALDLTADPVAFCAMIKALSVQGLAPLVSAGGLAGSGCTHPAAATRMAAAEQWALNRHDPVP